MINYYTNSDRDIMSLKRATLNILNDSSKTKAS